MLQSPDPIFALLARRAEARAAMDAGIRDEGLDEDSIGRLMKAECVASYAALTTEPTTLAGLGAFAAFGLHLHRESVADEHEGLGDWNLGWAAGTDDERDAEEIFLTTLANAAGKLCGGAA